MQAVEQVGHVVRRGVPPLQLFLHAEIRIAFEHPGERLCCLRVAQLAKRCRLQQVAPVEVGQADPLGQRIGLGIVVTVICGAGKAKEIPARVQRVQQLSPARQLRSQLECA